MPVEINIHSDLVNSGRVRDVLDQIGKFVTAESPDGSLYEVKLMVPLKTPLDRKVVFNTSKRTYFMYAFCPKLPFRACKRCFVLYHNDDLCREIQRKVFVRAFPAPSPRVSHVAVMNFQTRSTTGESSKSRNSKEADQNASVVAPLDQSKPSAFSVSLQPSAATKSTCSSFFSPIYSSALHKLAHLTIRESGTNDFHATRSSVGLNHSFNNIAFDSDGLIHDRKGKRTRTSFESVVQENSVVNSSFTMVPTPHWPPISSVPPFCPPSDIVFNSGSSGFSVGQGSEEANSLWSASSSYFSQAVFTSPSFIFTSATEMNCFSETLTHSSLINDFEQKVGQSEIPSEDLILEPMPLTMFPPEPGSYR